MKGSISQVTAGCSAMAAFAISILAGLAASNASLTILTRAILAMVVCYIVGLVVGIVIEHVLREHHEQRQRDQPVDEPGDDSPSTTDSSGEALV